MSMSTYMRELRARVGSRLLEVPSVSVACRDEAGRVLLARHSNGGVWVTPGGAIEPLETPADAAVREMWEETGLAVDLVRIVGVYGGPEFVVRYENGDRTSYLMIVFEARATAGSPRPDGHEVLETGFFAEREIDGLATPVWMGEILPDVFRPPRPARFRSPVWTPPPNG